MHLINLSNDEETNHTLTEFMNIGNDDNNQLKINDPNVSSRHFRIEKKEQEYTLKDLNSISGTFINGTKVIESYIKHNDIIKVGNTSLKVFNPKENKKLYNLSSKNIDWENQIKTLKSSANTDFPILISGESGTGKEVIAQWIHKNSSRKDQPIININCGALSESLIESELFGHIKGSFTGAHCNRKGAFESANGGTLFLDEIGELPLSLQPKILRALENQEIRPLGSDKTRKVNFRLITATHQNLKEKIAKKEFRSDLFYRLNVLSIYPPPLRQRVEDFDFFIFKFAKEYKVRISYSAIEEIKNHTWPGNIRELKNFIARLSAVFPHKHINDADVTFLLSDSMEEKIKKEIESSIEHSPLSLRGLEKNIIIDRLISNSGNQRKTARELGLPKSTLHDRIKSYRLNIDSFKK